MSRYTIYSLLGGVVIAGLLFAAPASAQPPYGGQPVVAERQARRADRWAADRMPYYFNYHNPYYFDNPAFSRSDGAGWWGSFPQVFPGELATRPTYPPYGPAYPSQQTPVVRPGSPKYYRYNR